MKKLIDCLQTPRALAAAIVLVSMATLAAAYISQYGFGLKPCILCLYQRVPYFINIALGIFAVAATFRYPRLAIALIAMAGFSFFTDAAIAAFHVGVEQKWWKGLPECGGDIVPKGVSIEELRNALTHQNIVRCDEAAWRLFGISMAGYNFIMCLIFGVGTFLVLRRQQRGA